MSSCPAASVATRGTAGVLLGRLQMAMLIGNLGGKQELQRVARCRKQERPEQAGHIELGVEAVGEDPKHARLIFAVEATKLARSMERSRASADPLRPFPVLQEA